MVNPTYSISVDHTFKVGKPIGGFREEDNRFIKDFWKLFIVLNENGCVTDWALTQTVSLEEVKPMMKSIKTKMQDTSLKYIFSDTCCGAKSMYEEVFPEAMIKLDLFHACQRITKVLPNKKSVSTQTFSKEFGLIFRREGDVNDIRNFETPAKEVILKNLDRFLKNQELYINDLQVCKKQELFSEIEKLKVHINKGCLSGIPPGSGTEDNERLHRYLNRSFIKGANVISPELARAVLTVLFYVHNSKLLSEKKSKTSYFKLVPFNEVACEEFRNNVEISNNFIMRQDDLKDTNVMSGLIHCIEGIHSSLLDIGQQCQRKGFHLDKLLFSSDNLDKEVIKDSSNSSVQLNLNLSYFNLKIDPVNDDGDCLFRSILKQIYGVLESEAVTETFKTHCQTLKIDKASDILEQIIQLRYICF